MSKKNARRTWKKLKCSFRKQLVMSQTKKKKNRVPLNFVVTGAMKKKISKSGQITQGRKRETKKKEPNLE